MKRFVSLFAFLIIVSTLAVMGQYDARQMPSFLRYDYQKPEAVFGKARVFIRGDRNVNGPKLDIPERILSEDGFVIKNISGTRGAQDETCITYNPQNPKNIVAASNNTRYNHAGVGYKMAAYYTNDGGQNWGVSTTPSNMGLYIERPANGGMTNFDPGLAFDTQGNIYYSYGFAQIGDDDASNDNGVFVCKSTDGGQSWLDPIPVALEANGSSNQAFHDRYSIACDINEDSPYKDRVYITWQRFKVNPGVMFSYSKNGNESWSPIIKLSGTTYNTQAPMPAVGPNGEVYVAWRQSAANQTTNMLIQKSTDGGKTWWSSYKKMMNIGNLGTINSESHRNVLPDKQQIRISSNPFIAVDNSHSPRRGWVYMVTAGKDESGKPHIVLTKSTDGGNTWSNKQVIDDNHNGTDVFFPSISVDPVTGMVSIFYYSSQNDNKNKGVDGYIAVSFDGNHFNVFRLTPQTWYLDDPQDVSWQGAGNYYWGDYTGITSYNATAYPVFWMPNSPTGTYYSNTSYIAEVSALPLPPSDFTYVNTSDEPTKVILNWVDPNKNRLGGNLGNFKILVYKGSDKIAEVDKGVQTYTDNSAVEGEVFTYHLKTRTEEGIESDFVTVTGIAGGALEPKAPTDISTRIADNGIYVTWKNPSEHVDGTDLHDLSKIEIYADDQLAKTVTLPDIQAGEYSTALVELTTGKFYNISLVAVGTRHDNDTKSVPSDTVFNYAGAPLTAFNENFDDANNLVPTYIIGNPQWGITNKISKSSPNSFTDSPDGKYPNRAFNYAIFAPVVISAENPTLSWDHVAAVYGGDYAIVSISKDLKEWTDIASFDVNSYDEWTGDVMTSQWVDDHRTLMDYVGDTLYIRLLITSNILKNGDGWFVDNLRLDANPNSVEDLNKILDGINVSVNPNPVRDNANIDLHLSNPGNVSIDVYNILGQKMANVNTAFLTAGLHNFNFNTSLLPNGVYTVIVSVDGLAKVTRFVVNK